MTYRDRRAARAERLRAWSDKRIDAANAQLASDPELRHDIAFVTQPGRIPYRERMNRRDDAAFRSLDKAERMARRADEIDRQAAHAIYSDDVDATDRLVEKIAALEAERAEVVAYNRAVRKTGPTAELLETLSPKRRKDLAGLARIGVTRPDGSFPPYVTSNLSGNISRLRARLERLER